MVRSRRHVLHCTVAEDKALWQWCASYEREPAQMLRWLLRSVFEGRPDSRLDQLALNASSESTPAAA